MRGKGGLEDGRINELIYRWIHGQILIWGG
jgi:hypothetical protein